MRVQQRDPMSETERVNAHHSFPSDELTYQLIRENRGILLSLTDSERQVAQLKVRLKTLKCGRVELIVEIEDAKIEISRLTLKLLDSAEEIAHLSSDLHHLEQGNPIGPP